MKTLCVIGQNKLGFREFPKPEIGDYDSLAEIVCCGICNSTDWKIIEGQFVPGTYPIALGHESIGRIVMTGPKVRSYKVGDMVIRPKLRDEHIQTDGGRSRWGGFSEYGVVTDVWAEKGEPYNAFPHPQQIVPNDITASDAVALITLKEVLSCLLRTEMQPGHSLAIVGTGPVAQGLTMWAHLYGIAPIVVFGRRPEHADRFIFLGATEYVLPNSSTKALLAVLENGGFDRAIEAVGSRTALSVCLQVLKKEGRVNVYGLAPDSEPYTPEQENDPRVFRSKVIEAEVHDIVLEHIRAGRVRLNSWYSHELPWEDFQKGFNMVQQKKAVKVVLKIAQ